MTTLQILRMPIENAPPDRPTEESLSLRRLRPQVQASAADSADAGTYTITAILDCLSLKDRGMKRVYRCTMRVDSTGESIAVVCKIAMGRLYFADLDREAEIYDAHLRDFQGTVVPHVYGFFVGPSFDGKTGALVMEDCGAPLRSHYSHYPTSFKKSLVDGLVELHRRARVVHQNLEYDISHKGHVVARRLPSGKLHATLVSFGNAKTHHRCQFNGEIVPDTPHPHSSELPCWEVREIAWSSEIFTRDTVHYGSCEVPAEWALDPETLVKEAGIPDYLTAEQAFVEATRVCAEHADWLKRRAECDANEDSFAL